MNFLESSAGRIAARIQEMGAAFDPDVLTLPGGSLIAVGIWLYGNAAMRLKRGTARKPATACCGPRT